MTGFSNSDLTQIDGPVIIKQEDMIVKVCIMQNSELHGHCWVYQHGKLIALQFYQDNLLISSLTSYAENIQLPDSKD